VTEIQPVRVAADTTGAQVLGDIGVLMKQEADKLEDVVAEDALNKLREKRLDMSLGEKGFANVRGGAVVSQKPLDVFPGQFDREVEALAANIGGARARERFNAKAAAEKSGYRQDLMRHVANETNAYQADTAKATLATESKYAAMNYGDDAAMLSSIGRVSNTIANEAKRLGLQGPALELYRQEALGTLHGSVVQKMLTDGKAADAVAYLEAAKGDMSERQINHYAPQVKQAGDWALGEEVGIEAAALPPKDAQALISTKTKGNKGAFAAAQTVLTQREQAAAAADRQTKGGLISAFSDNPTQRTAARLEASPEFLAMTPAAQGEFKEYTRHQAQAADDRARGLADRAEFKARQRWDDNPAALGVFYQLADMPELGAMTTEQVYSYAPAIGPKLIGVLEQKRRELANGATRFQIDKDLLGEAIPPALLAPGNKDQLRAFNGLVERNLQTWKIENPGKMPDLATQTRIARSANQDYVKIGSFWNDTLPAYAVKPETKAIPKAFFDEMKKIGAKDSEVTAAWALKQGSK